MLKLTIYSHDLYDAYGDAFFGVLKLKVTTWVEGVVGVKKMRNWNKRTFLEKDSPFHSVSCMDLGVQVVLCGFKGQHD